MDHHIIKQIVIEIFKKAKQGSVSHTPHALSQHIEDETNEKIKAKTANRAHKKYIQNHNNIGAPIPETVNSFCRFLGYDNYKNYKEKIQKNKPEIDKSKHEDDVNDNKRKWILIITIPSFVILFFFYDYLSKPEDKIDNKTIIETTCMAWAKDHYEKVDCNLQSHPKYGTKTEPFFLSKSAMKRIEVNASTDFFSEVTGQPLVWYYKTKKGTLEYYNLPGLHPLNGETLKKITKGMIEKNVPIHITNPDSFVSSNTTESKKADVTISQDFDKSIFRFIESLSKDLNDYDENFQIIIYPFKFNKENEAMLAEYVTEEFWIITSQKAINFEVMDRATFEEYFKEHKLNNDNLIDPKTAKQFGMLIAADAYVTGKVYVFNSIIKLRVTVTDTQTGKLIATKSGNLSITKDIANYIGIKD